MSKPIQSPMARTLEVKAVTIERTIAFKTSSNAALEAAITSAELYMQALKLTSTPSERRRLDHKCKELLAKAESIKAAQDGKPATPKAYPGDMKQPNSTRKLTTRENIIILEGSKLNNATFKPWSQPPTSIDFELKNGQDLYLEKPPLPLSAAQQNLFAGWKRPNDALTMIEVLKNGVRLANSPTMVTHAGKIDLVQDIASDCSVVASLCAGTARAERGHPRILGSILHPYDYDKDCIVISPNGKYVLRLYFNGCWRRVDIDDLLPTSRTNRVLHVVDRSHPGLLWPALVEKAYLKVRGGYDFPGSNSGTDLAVITGWIPQQVFLHDQDVDHNDLWSDIFRGFQSGDVLLTIGTGKLPVREQKQLGLAAEHDYAILDLKEASNGVREMLIKNPWSDGDVWVGALKRRPNTTRSISSTPQYDSEHVQDSDDSEMMPGTFWMDFNSVFHYFENIYINWNPGLFTNRQDLHFTWNVPGGRAVSNVFVDNPQFSVRVAAKGELWLLLNRHFRTGDYTHANSGKNGYISLYVFNRNGMRVFSSESAMSRGAFVDSPNTLLRLQATINTVYTVVVVSQDLPSGKHNFTLSTLANSAVTLDDCQSRYQNQTSISAAWTRGTAGGNSDSSRYLNNPQFSFFIASDNTKVALVLRIVSDPDSGTNETNLHVKLLVLYNASNHRITKLRPRDTIANSGDYRRGSAVVETTLSRGSYVLICSTFEEGQQGRFQIDLYTSSTPPSEHGAKLTAIPAESSGRLSIISPPATFPDGVIKLIAPISFTRVSRAIFIAHQSRSLHHYSPASSNSLYRISLQRGQGPYAQIIASSADDTVEFCNIASGLRIEDQDLNPTIFSLQTGGLWLVLERPPGQSSASSESHTSGESLEIEILAEERIEVGSWNIVDD